jgi:hypothetical protein
MTWTSASGFTAKGPANGLSWDAISSRHAATAEAKIPIVIAVVARFSL